MLRINARARAERARHPSGHGPSEPFDLDEIVTTITGGRQWTLTMSRRRRVRCGSGSTSIAPVEPEVIEECIELAIQAPTGSNSQGLALRSSSPTPTRGRRSPSWYMAGWDMAYGRRRRGSASVPEDSARSRSACSSSADYLANNLAAGSGARDPVHPRPSRRDRRPRDGPDSWARSSRPSGRSSWRCGAAGSARRTRRFICSTRRRRRSCSGSRTP